MSALIDLYRAQLRIAIASQLQYRFGALIWVLSTVLQPAIYLVVWSSVARSHGGRVGDYASATFAAYFIVLMLVGHVTDTWSMWNFEFRIREGQFSPLLLRPVSPIHGDIAENLAYKLLTLSVMVPAAGGLVLAFRPALHPEPWMLVALLPALVLAWGINFLLGWLVGLATFWTTRVAGIFQLYYTALLLFSGQIAPLSLFPAPFQTVAAVLPFRWIIAFPVELALGRVSAGRICLGLGAQILWLGIELALLAVTWQATMRRYSAVGA